jgi:hypothetical protein
MARNIIGYFVYASFFTIIFLSGINNLKAQNARFLMETDRSQVHAGETFLLDIILENIDGSNLQLPDMAPFKIVQGPSTSTSVTIINGKRSGSQKYQYLLLAPQKGKYSIGAASLKIGSRIIKSNMLEIEVIASDTASKSVSVNSDEETFIRLEMSEENGYTGQQLILNLVLYTRTNIESYQLLQEPDFDGFFSQPINDIRDQPQRKDIKGKEYYTQVIRRWALFPQKTGQYTLGPLKCNLDVAVENGQSSFFFRDTRQVPAISNVLKLKIIDLPSKAPESFSGGVGNFTMSAEIQKSTVMTGEAIAIRMQIHGDGDARIVQAPHFILPESLEKYNPSIIKDETIQKTDRVLMDKEFEFLMVPKVDTILSIQPEFSYFDVSSQEYKKIVAGPYVVNVVKGNGSISTQTDEKYQISPLSDDRTLYNTKKGFFGSQLYLILFIGIIVLSILMYFFKNYRDRKALDSKLMEHNISTVSKRCLQKAFAHKEKDEPALFYEEIAMATSGYILKKYNIPNADSSTDEIAACLANSQVPQEVISTYVEMQKKCELARFANVFHDMSAIYTKAEWIISRLEKLSI